MSKVNFKPLADRVLVEPEAAEEKTASEVASFCFNCTFQGEAIITIGTPLI